MVYFANLGNNQCLRGSVSLLIGPEATGMYNGSFVACFGWPYWTASSRNAGRSSWGKYIHQCSLPYISTSKTVNTNLSYGTYLRWYGRPFGLNLDSNSGIAAVGFYGNNPTNAGGTNLGQGFMAGYNHVGVSGRGNSVGITCTDAYGYAFQNWRLGTGSGTLITTTRTTNLYFNSTYGGQNFKDVKTFFATGN